MPVLTGIFGVLVSGARMVAAIITSANLLIAGIAVTLLWVLGVLPSMPAAPDPADVLGTHGAQILGTINWLLPVGQIITTFGVFLALYVAFLVVRVILRWVKAL